MQPKTTNEEQELFIKGDDKDCEHFFARYYRIGFNTAKFKLGDEAEAKDAIQEVFVRLWTMDRKEKRKVENFQQYFVQSIRNHCLSLIDKQKRRKIRLNGYPPETYTEPYDSSKEEQLKAVLNEIEGLSDKCRDVFRLVYVCGFTHEQVARLKGLSKNTIKTQIYSSIKKIKKKLDIK